MLATYHVCRVDKVACPHFPQANLQSRPFIKYYLVNTTTPYDPATAYDTNTNTTVLDAVVTDGGAGYSEDPITLDVADADRNGWPSGVASSRNDGLTEMHMWRPGTYDPQTSQPTSYFNSAFIANTQQFSLIRLMQTFGKAGDGVAYSRLVNWSDRPLPGIMYAHLGIPYEEAILLANLTDKDVWINIPLHASDEFIRNVALTFAFGSDRSTGRPFTGPYGSTDNPYPATHDPSTWTISTYDWYPPLAAGRHVYIEWSNEIWNYNNGEDETVSPSARVAATASVAGGDPWRIAWDGTADVGVLMHRLTMAKAIQIGLEFRRAFGDAVCNDAGKDPSTVRVRNVFAYQAYGVSSVDTIAGKTNWIEAARDYFDNVWGPGAPQQDLGPTDYQFSNRPGGNAKPDAYYLWGASSGGYISFDNVGKCSSIDEALNWSRRAWDGYNLDGSVAYASGGVTDKQARGWGNAPYKFSMKAEHDWWWQRGIRFSLYEANHGLGGSGSNSIEQSAAEDPRLADLLLSATTYLYTLPGVDVWVHFSLTENYCWGVTPDLYSTGTYVGKTYTTALAAGASRTAATPSSLR